MKDLYSKLAVAQMVAAAVQTGQNTSAAQDLQGYNSALVLIETGAIDAAGAFSVKLQESDTTTAADFTDVEAKDLQGAVASPLAANSVYKLGYIGSKRYLRTILTKAGGTSIAAGIVLVKGHGHDNPQE